MSNQPESVELQSGIWRHTKTKRLYYLNGIGTLKQKLHPPYPSSLVGGGRYSEDRTQLLMIWLVSGCVRPGGQWVIEAMNRRRIKELIPDQPYVVYNDLQGVGSHDTEYWVRPLDGPAGWRTPIVLNDHTALPRFTFISASGPV